MSLSGSSASRNSIWAMTRFASSSSMNVGRKMIRSLSRREKMSNARSPRGVCSTTIGTRAIVRSFAVRDSLFMDVSVGDQEVQRHALAKAGPQGVQITALLHHTPDCRRGTPSGAGDPVHLALQIGLAGSDALPLGHGLQQQRPPDGALGGRAQLLEQLGVVPLDRVGVDVLAAQALAGVLHLMADLPEDQRLGYGELLPRGQRVHHPILQAVSIFGGPPSLQLLEDLGP